MTNRELVLAAIKRKSKYIPFQFNLCPSQEKKFFELYGHYDYKKQFKMPYHFVFLDAKKSDIDFSEYFSSPLGDGVTFNEFGVAFCKGSDNNSHFTHMVPSMTAIGSIEDVDKYPYPHPTNSYDYAALKKQVAALKKDDKITVGALDMTIFEIGWYMWGMDRMLMDLLVEDDVCLYHLDKVTAIRQQMAINMVNTGIDVLHLGDDVATQIDMMMSPELWRTHLKPRLKSVIDAAKTANKDIIIDYHSDGNIEKIVEDLIEIGVDVLNPIQPECMNPIELKQKYGDKICFRGCIGTQSTLPFGTSEQVREQVRKLIEQVGYNGGLILAPSHIIEPEVPWENVMALISEINEYNNRLI